MIKRIYITTFIALAFSFSLHSTARAEINAVATIKPIHSLAAAVMEGIAQPYLVVKSADSPHGYQLRPSDARKFEQADAVFWIGPNFETTMNRVISNLSQNAVIVELSEVGGLTLFEFRESIDEHGHDEHHDGEEDEHAEHEEEHDDHGHDHAKHDEDHDEHKHAEHEEEHDDHGHDHAEHDEDHGEHEHAEHEEEHDDHGHDHAEHDEEHDEHMHAEHEEEHDDHHDHDHAGGIDMHVWLDIGNAKLMSQAIAEALSHAYPQYEQELQSNLKRVLTKLDALETELHAQAESIGDKPYIVFHDAYQYLEKSFGLNNVGAVHVNPERSPGARKIGELRETVHRTGAVCAFAEPQFNSRVLDVVVEGAEIRMGVLDPLGADIEPGPEAYFQLMRNLIGALRDCLG